MRFIGLCLALLLLLTMSPAVQAAEMECDSVYCFSGEDFAEEELSGICILELPESGAVLLGSRIICPGDILTAGQVEQMTYSPLPSEEDAVAVIGYLPIYDGYVAQAEEMTISIRGRRDDAPAAEDFAMETYRNIPNEGTLKATDPEGKTLLYTISRQPRRGSVTLNADGTFTYTPKKNKVGVDSFTYTATDPAGNVSREATVTVRILKTTDAPEYTDTLGLPCRFEAEWLKHTGLFTGEQLGGTACFCPERAVTQGQFLAMVTQLLELPESKIAVAGSETLPRWLQPYYAAALRSGLTAGLETDGASFDADAPITAETAALILQNALQLPSATPTAASGVKEEAPTMGELALAAMADNGLALAGEVLTRAEAAKLLYRVSLLAATAPGMTALNQSA